MAFEYLTNVPLDQAKKDYLNKLRENGFAGKTETILVSDAYGRITAKAVYARINAPHYAASAMDGVALHAKDSFGATETTPVTLRPGQFIVVDTGDPIPEGCDAVIMVEDILQNDDGSVTIHAPAAPWQHIRQIGEDICAGEMILPGFMEVSAAARVSPSSPQAMRSSRPVPIRSPGIFWNSIPPSSPPCCGNGTRCR